MSATRLHLRALTTSRSVEKSEVSTRTAPYRSWLIGLTRACRHRADAQAWLEVLPDAADSGEYARWLPARLIPHRHRPRAELPPAHELQVDMLREPGEQRRPVTHQPGLHHELVLIDQAQLRQRQRERHAAHEQSLPRLPLQLFNGRPQLLPGHELRVPIDPVQGARDDVLLRRVDRPGEGLHPLGHPLRPHARPRRPPRGLHHFVGDPAKEEGIGLREALGPVTMQLFVRGHGPMIAAPVQGDVDGIPQGSHSVSLPLITVRWDVFLETGPGDPSSRTGMDLTDQQWTIICPWSARRASE